MARKRSFSEWLADGRRHPPLHLLRGPGWWSRLVTEWQPVGKWNDGLNVEKAINEVGGPFIEIGGPSLARELGAQGGHIVNTAKLAEPVRITNFVAGAGEERRLQLGRLPFHREVRISRQQQKGRVEEVVDARQMPYSDESVGLLTATALYYDGSDSLMDGFIQEAQRVLRPGGFVVGESIYESSVEKMLEHGFEPVRARRVWYPGDTPDEVKPEFDVIARKPGRMRRA